MALLELSEVHAHYGLAHVLHGVSLACEEGEAVALLGRNGQGKTTTIRSILSLLVPRRGRVSFDGTNITGWPAHAIARKGISVVPEGRHIFPALSVFDHLRVPVTPPGVDRAERLRLVFDLFPELRARKDADARSLSGGQQQLLVIARALMMKPRLLLLDEPMEGLAPKAVTRVIEALATIRDLGVTVFFASTNCELAFRVASRACIIEKGRVVHQASREALLGDLQAQRHYLGVRG
jgi:branched-chain amino acid transport system ATP-binding protein